ncbi:MAG TPA: imidazolonepropionase, partial [Saprospirales bacterium]|nr:imidazolonepropionase [Saprospirales bacterium]
EAINAATLNGARAMELETDYGTIAVGKVANLMITRPMLSLAGLPYAFGSKVVEQVVVGGRLRECA